MFSTGCDIVCSQCRFSSAVGTNDGNARIKSNIEVDTLDDDPLFGIPEADFRQLKKGRGDLLCLGESSAMNSDSGRDAEV